MTGNDKLLVVGTQRSFFFFFKLRLKYWHPPALCRLLTTVKTNARQERRIHYNDIETAGLFISTPISALRQNSAHFHTAVSLL